MFQNSSWLITIGMLLLLSHVIMSPILFVWISSLYLNHTIPTSYSMFACFWKFENKIIFPVSVKITILTSQWSTSRRESQSTSREISIHRGVPRAARRNYLERAWRCKHGISDFLRRFRKHLMTGLSVRLSVKSRLPTVLSRESLSYWWFLLPRGPRGFRDW